MKIAASIRSLYANLYDIASELEKYVSVNVRDFCEKNSYQYKSRIKSENSFAEKIETGWDEMHDFFGITIVVPDYSCITRVKKYLSSLFVLVHQRPLNPKKPQDFDFDTPRYYYRCKRSLSLQNKSFKNFVFEVQIVTELEYCWIKLFHDYSYKSTDIDWNKERISFQIKALLKNADMIIYEADKLAKSKILKDYQDDYTKLNKIKSFLLKYWEPHCLANNLKRECKTIETIMGCAQITLDELERIVKKYTDKGRGANLINLSPHGAIIQTLLDENHQEFKKYIQKKIDMTKNKKILIVDEIELPEDVVLTSNSNGQKIKYYKNCTCYVATKTDKTKTEK